ncbi:MAG: hypothetical protein KME08_08445 [Aphanothece sp. CMT-3BRIN-NPC111]|jgi:spermidine synthase|nr:hypothetical protein [Aphanothece sp. CMT-3BRIN-NPC111]
MPISLFIEQHSSGIAFYINGDLQFDTADEALYHEYLVIPPVALAQQRFFQTDLRVLICGGGDGLAARDVLRFPQVQHIDLVDYNPEVLELARTVFKPYNNASLESDRITVYTQEAFEFVSAIPDNYYHVIICDFTYPTCQEDTSIYSREWFQQINRVLYPDGIVSTNGVSPENRTTGFWCLYQTLLSAGLMVKPLQVDIPSFRRHGYGNWGFFLASNRDIKRFELERIALPQSLQALTGEDLWQAFIFPDKIAQVRHEAAIHSLDYPQLFYYLLNHTFTLPKDNDLNVTVDFIDIQESGNGLLAKSDLLKIESVAKAWREQIYQYSGSTDNHADISQLLPVQHRYHSPKMTKEWLAYLKQLLAEIDLNSLLNSLLERSHQLPERMASELRQLADKIRTKQPLASLPPQTTQLLMVLSITLLMANLITPDAVFAKGYYSGSSGSSDDYDGEVEGEAKIWGFFLTAMGGFWLYSIFTRSNDE